MSVPRLSIPTVDIGARQRMGEEVCVRPLPNTHSPHSQRHQSSAQLHTFLHHVSDASYNRIFKFLTLPSNLPSCPEVLPKADQERPPHPSACPPVAGLRLYYRHTRNSSRSSSRIRQISQRRREIDEVVGPNCERPQRVFCHHFRWCQSGTSQLLA